MNTIIMQFDTHLGGIYIKLEINYIPAGIVNILHNGKAPDPDVIEIIEKNYTNIVKAIIEEQIRLAYELRAKEETKPYSEIEAYLNNLNDIQRLTGG